MKKTLCPIIFLMLLLLAGFRENSNAEPAGTIPIDDISTYCCLLHVGQKASLHISPRSYLGIYHAEQKVSKPPSPYPAATYIHAAGVIKGSPADAAGLKKDDVILSVNGQPTCRDTGKITAIFKKEIEKFPIGAEIQLKVLRGDKILPLMVKTSSWPEHQQPEAVHPEVPSCTGESSLLQTALKDGGNLPAFQNTITGLYRQSNHFHNMGSSWETPFHPFQLKEMTYMLRNPLKAGLAAKAISLKLTEPLQEADRSLNKMLCRIAELTDVEVPHCAETPKEITFPALVEALEESASRVRKATSNFSAEELTILRKKALNPEDDKEWNAFLEISLRIDRRKLYEALAPLTSFLTEKNMSLLRKDLLKRFNHGKGGILYQTQTSAGLVIVGGKESKIYDQDAALILDLGGHNLYTNNAGGTRPDIPVALTIDWGGHNRYIAREDFSQGAAVLGGGFLIDLGGHSTFIAENGSQGAGFGGIGLLYHGKGSSVLHARSNSQGTGQVGIGLLIGQGRGIYSCLHKGQGLGLFGGAGILINQAGGNVYQLGGLKPDFRDPEKSTESLGQGFGFGIRSDGDNLGAPGGIGVFIDEKGGNTYIADYFAQGASYYYGVGILDNRGGHNRYIAGRYAQGAGIHTSVGVLQNSGGGNTFFSSVGVSQGMGHDYGVGLLQNGGDENDYRGGVLIQGAATHGGLGILIDQGEKSRMTSHANGRGFAQDDECLGLFFHANKEEDRSDKTVVKIGIRKKTADKPPEQKDTR